MGSPTSWHQGHVTWAIGLLKYLCLLYLCLLSLPLVCYHLVSPGLSLGPLAFLFLLYSLAWCTHLDSISTYIHVCPRTLSPARTLYPRFSPVFLNVYETRQVDISLPSKTNISKPDFITSLPKAAYVGCLSMSSRNAGVPSSLVHLPPASSSHHCPLDLAHSHPVFCKPYSCFCCTISSDPTSHYYFPSPRTIPDISCLQVKIYIHINTLKEVINRKAFSGHPAHAQRDQERFLSHVF